MATWCIKCVLCANFLHFFAFIISLILMASSEEEKKYIIVLADTLFFYGPQQCPDILLFRINVDKSAYKNSTNPTGLPWAAGHDSRRGQAERTSTISSWTRSNLSTHPPSTRTPLFRRLFFPLYCSSSAQEAIHHHRTGVGYYTTSVARTSINLVSLCCECVEFVRETLASQGVDRQEGKNFARTPEFEP